ncbi:CoA-binding protein [Luteibaculum oceani]|uniref:CoA-binding protein n=1 Tax=Luteibaculum oceani TaxID=1294296 RepID=A0A5C6UTU5_9FLAO|nr:CoA-binding protein [Luteibaculum oceani]TXC76044.1 CoA-binding protein [Luteibaculum oceani]
MNKSTLVVGASENPQRYSYLAINRLVENKVQPIYAVSLKSGEVSGVPFMTEFPDFKVDTVTLYVGPRHQEAVAAYMEKYPPNRVIFNPGTESPLMDSLKSKGVAVLPACTLVMLASNQY